MVLFVVSTWGEGKGGHFNTLATYLKPFEQSYQILVLGKNIPSVLIDFQSNIIRADLSFLPQLELSEKFEIIHCFDQWAYLYGFLIALKLRKVKLVLTKSGGINTIWFPRAKNMWLISKENYDYYSKFKTVTNIDFYDNRVVDFDLIDVSELKGKFQSSCVVLRIGRISEYYRASFNKMMEYSKKFKECKFVIIGTVESEQLYSELIAAEIEVLYQKEYTENAKRYLGLGDLFLGQGRSAMEAIYKGIQTFVYNKANNDLELVDIDNIQQVKFQNFSERASFHSNFNLEKYLNSKGNKSMVSLREYVAYDPRRLLDYYDSLELKKVYYNSFPLLLFIRYIRKILKMKV